MIDDGYAAAEDYLTLHFGRDTAKGLADRLRRENVQYFKVKDVLRAARLSGWEGCGGEADRVVLLVRSSSALIVADGVEAVQSQPLDKKIPCKIV